MLVADPIVVRLVLDRLTRGSARYIQALDDESIVEGPVYIKRSAFQKHVPESVTMLVNRFFDLSDINLADE